MKAFTQYFPFILLSVVLYGLAFSYNRQSTIILPLPLNSGEQSMQVQFIAPPAPTPVTDTDALKQPVDAIEQQHSKSEPEPESESVPESESEPKIKITAKAPLTATAQSQVKIPQEQAVNGKAAEKHSRQTTAATKLAVTKPAVTNTTVTETASTTETGQQSTDKPVFKKQPAPETQATANPAATQTAQENKLQQGVLQHAVVVSGNRPIYPKRAILRSQQGRVVVKLTVTRQGKPKNPEIMTSSGYAILDDAIIDFVDNELFMPALKGNDKVSSEQIFAFRFQLK